VIEKAIGFAMSAHAGSYRDGEDPLPYVTHPVEVMSNLRYVGGISDEIMLCAAMLHDVIEETSLSSKDLLSAFGEEITNLVIELTRHEPSQEEISGMSKQEIWSLRSAILLSEISAMSKEAQAIKLADRLANLRQAKVTRTSSKLARYMNQTEKILEIIPKNVNSRLWQAIRAELG
jgi:GTP diphosphokinase / guanosine-3',5'-bis(diphosphate) 3'-diphosphatase